MVAYDNNHNYIDYNECFNHRYNRFETLIAYGLQMSTMFLIAGMTIVSRVKAKNVIL